VENPRRWAGLGTLEIYADRVVHTAPAPFWSWAVCRTEGWRFSWAHHSHWPKLSEDAIQMGVSGVDVAIVARCRGHNPTTLLVFSSVGEPLALRNTLEVLLQPEPPRANPPAWAVGVADAMADGGKRSGEALLAAGQATAHAVDQWRDDMTSSTPRTEEGLVVPPAVIGVVDGVGTGVGIAAAGVGAVADVLVSGVDGLVDFAGKRTGDLLREPTRPFFESEFGATVMAIGEGTLQGASGLVGGAVPAVVTPVVSGAQSAHALIEHRCGESTGHLLSSSANIVGNAVQVAPKVLKLAPHALAHRAMVHGAVGAASGMAGDDDRADSVAVQRLRKSSSERLPVTAASASGGEDAAAGLIQPEPRAAATVNATSSSRVATSATEKCNATVNDLLSPF